MIRGKFPLSPPSTISDYYTFDHDHTYHYRHQTAADAFMVGKY